MKDELVKLPMGTKVPMQLIKTYKNGKLFFCQERIYITTLDNTVINSNDIIDFVEEVL